MVHLTPGVPVVHHVALTPASSISGAVTVAGQPASGGSVDLYSATQSEYGYPGWIGSAPIDPEGKYRIRRVPAGDYLLHFQDDFQTGDGIPEWYADSPDWQGATTVALAEGETKTGLDADLIKGGSITGTVVDDAGGAIPGCSAWAQKTDFSTWRSDCPNGVLVRGLPSGTYRVDVTAPGYVSVSVGGDDGVAVVVGEATDVGQISMEAAAVLTGRIISELTGEPAQGSVCAYPIDSESCIGSGWAGVYGSPTDGHYRIDTLPAGEYHLQVQPSPGVSEWYRDQPTRELADAVTLAADGTEHVVDFEVSQGHSISGTVQMRTTGDPVAATVVLSQADDVTRALASQVADSAGSFSFPGLEDGDYILSSWRDGLDSQYYDGVYERSASTRIEVRDADVAGITIRMKRQTSIAGTVTTESGAPLEGAYVSLIPQEAGLSTWGTGTGQDGSFSFPIRAPGGYRLQFSSPSGGAYLSEYWDNSPNIQNSTVIEVTQAQYDDGEALSGYDAALTRAAYTISGTVTDDTGAPLARMPVTANNTYTGDTNRLGQYELGVPLGEFRVRFGSRQQAYDWDRAGDYRAEYYPDAVAYSDAQILTIDEADESTHHLTGIDESLLIGGAITGTVRDWETGEGLVHEGYVTRRVEVWAQPITAGLQSRWAETDSTGAYRIPGLAAGQYRVNVYYGDPNLENLIIRYFEDTGSFASATPVDTVLGTDSPGKDLTVSRTPPSAPEGLAVQPGSTAAVFSWQPADTSGNDLRQYQVRIEPGPIVRDIGSSQDPNTEITVTGLENGTEYSATARTRTDVGWSTWSDPVAFTPGSLLEWSAPPVATRADEAIDVEWTPPVANGAEILGYYVQAVDGDGNPAAGSVSVGPWATSARVKGLVNGTEYTVVVRARNEIGTTDSEPSNPVIPAGPPVAPPQVSVTPGDRTLDISWDPADGNGAPVLGYLVTAHRLDGVDTELEVGPDVRQASFSDLVNGAVYELGVRATNDVGIGRPRWSDEVRPRSGPNSAPIAGLSVTPTDGEAPLAVAATVSYSDSDADWLTYRIDYGDGGGIKRQVVEAGSAVLSHTFEKVGIFQVRLTVDDGLQVTEETQTVTVASPEPLRAIAGDDRVVPIHEAVDFDGSASQPVGIPHTYAWDFGDGQTAGGPTTQHAYSAAGDYTVTLTVDDGVDQSTDEVHISVLEPSGQGLAVSVSASGTLLSGATVAVNDPIGTRYSCVTTNLGECTLTGVPDGEWAVLAYAPGYLTDTKTATVTGGVGRVEIALEPGPIGTAELQTRRLDASEVEALGIDPNDPDNQNVIQFSVVVAGTDKELTGVANRGTCWCDGDAWKGWSDEKRTYHPSYRVVDGRPTVVVLATAKASWLKEFFQVDLVVVNLADDGFTFSGGVASLSLPRGLSLAPTAETQSLSQQVADIPGSQTGQVTWIVRGDSKGNYPLSATYAATLEPVGAPISLLAESKEPLRVWGTDAIQLDAVLDETAYKHHPYPFEIELTNVADVPIYNVQLEMVDGDWIFQPQQQRVRSMGEMAPGGKLSLPIRVVPDEDRFLAAGDAVLAMVAGADSYAKFVDLRQPAVTPGTAPAISADTSLSKRVVLSWDAIPGATGYRVFRTDSDGTPFPGEPITETDGEELTATIAQESETTGYFAVSTLVDGRPMMLHPLTSATATLGSPPEIRMRDLTNDAALDDGARLGISDTARTVRFVARDPDEPAPAIRVTIQDSAGVTVTDSRIVCTAAQDADATIDCEVPAGSVSELATAEATDADGRSAVASFSVGLAIDSDGDGLLDDWEMNGYDHDGDGVIDVDLPAMGATPDRKDLFVEVDWMDDALGCLHFEGMPCWSTIALSPDLYALDDVVHAFDRSPVDDGKGIRLHIDAGPYSAMNPDTHQLWGELGRGNEVDFVEDPMVDAGNRSGALVHVIRAENLEECAAPRSSTTPFTAPLLRGWRGAAISDSINDFDGDAGRLHS